MVHWLARHAFTAKDPDSIPGWGTKILQATQHSQKRKRAKYHVGLSPHSQAEILPGEPSCDLRDSREVTVVLSKWSRKLALQTHQIHPPGCLAQSTMKLSDGSAGKGCWLLGAADCPAPRLDMEAAHAAEAGSWRSCRNLPGVAHET